MGKARFWFGAISESSGYGGLRQAARDGVILPSDLDEGLARCRACRHPTACDLTSSLVAPLSCRNVALMRELGHS